MLSAQGKSLARASETVEISEGAWGADIDSKIGKET